MAQSLTNTERFLERIANALERLADETERENRLQANDTVLERMAKVQEEAVQEQREAALRRKEWERVELEHMKACEKRFHARLQELKDEEAREREAIN